MSRILVNFRDTYVPGEVVAIIIAVIPTCMVCADTVRPARASGTSVWKLVVMKNIFRCSRHGLRVAASVRVVASYWTQRVVGAVKILHQQLCHSRIITREINHAFSGFLAAVRSLLTKPKHYSTFPPKRTAPLKKPARLHTTTLCTL